MVFFFQIGLVSAELVGSFSEGFHASRGGPPPLPPELEAFKRLISSCGKRKGSPLSQSFVKKTDIPSVDLSTERPWQNSLNLAECGLIGQFTRLWPSPKAVEGWVQ